MLIDKAAFRHPRGSDVRAWKSGSSTAPQWVEDAIDQRSSNGTFLLKTTLGDRRVHEGEVVVEQAGELYVCDAGDLDEQIAGRRANAAVGSSPQAAVGPGKKVASPVPARRSRWWRAPSWR